MSVQPVPDALMSDGQAAREPNAIHDNDMAPMLRPITKQPTWLTDAGEQLAAEGTGAISGAESLAADLRRALDVSAVSDDIPGIDEDLEERVTEQEEKKLE